MNNSCAKYNHSGKQMTFFWSSKQPKGTFQIHIHLAFLRKLFIIFVSLIAIVSAVQHLPKGSSKKENVDKISGIDSPSSINTSSSPIETPFSYQLKYTSRNGNGNNLEVPPECQKWREIARNPSKLRLYRSHFNSHDVADWFLYVSMFGEKWHAERTWRPSYLDIAANHARRWSTTWFFDRCMGWDGICVEPNHVYWKELKAERHCKLVKRCLSDKQRKVSFSFTDAFGGVVADLKSSDFNDRLGVNGTKHSKDDKFSRHFHGIKEIVCTTLKDVLRAKLGSAHTHFDFMTLDVEGHELPILQGINWNSTVIDVIIIENRSPPVVRYLSEQNYEHFPRIHKDDIWIRKGSDIVMDRQGIEWMTLINRSTFQFPDGVKL